MPNTHTEGKSKPENGTIMENFMEKEEVKGLSEEELTSRIASLMQSMKSSDPEEIERVRAIVKKNVSFFERSAFAAYLLMNAAKPARQERRKEREKAEKTERADKIEKQDKYAYRDYGLCTCGTYPERAAFGIIAPERCYRRYKETEKSHLESAIDNIEAGITVFYAFNILI